MSRRDTIAAERSRDRLDHERYRLMLEYGHGSYRDRQVRDRIDAIDRELACLDRLSRALPLPRRYTGGPLEDGLYLWRRPWWHATSWAAFAVEGGHRHAFMGPTLYSTETVDVWLIGPLPIPPIPESEEQSDG